MRDKGSPVSRGIGIGPVFLFREEQLKIEERTVPAEMRGQEVERYLQAVAEAEEQLEKLYDACRKQGNQNAAIFQAHIDLIGDVQVREDIEAAIRTDGASAERAVSDVYAMYAQVLGASEDSLIRERAADLTDVSNRILQILMHVENGAGLKHLPKGAVLVAHDLLPSQTASLRADSLSGIITEIGGMTSHTAILAKSFGIPAVLGIPAALDTLRDGETVILDGFDGTVISEPTEEELTEYHAKQEAFLRRKAYEEQFMQKKAVTLDDCEIQVHLNIGGTDLSGYQTVLPYVDGVGLFRSEFLYMSRATLPSEDEQYETYVRTLKAFGNRPVILRTLDIGGDKKTDCIRIPREENPFLGLRALRLCFAKPELLRTQLRAAYRASTAGNLWIMFPMVNSLDDVRKAKACCREVCQELRKEGIPFSEDVKLGIMVETPAMAMMAREAAAEVDFASIGTNDLCQYTLAVDRLNPGVASYYMAYHPAVLRLIGIVADAFVQAGKPVSVCGELGGDPAIIPVLIGLGIHKLSMSASAVPGAKAVICGLNAAHAKALAQAALAQATEADVKQLLEKNK